jgi:hypothetical protein
LLWEPPAATRHRHRWRRDIAVFAGWFVAGLVGIVAAGVAVGVLIYYS